MEGRSEGGGKAPLALPEDEEESEDAAEVSEKLLKDTEAVLKNGEAASAIAAAEEV